MYRVTATAAERMYARFFRWASDRVDKNGIVAFITNRSFIESRTFDGFRKVVAEEFSEIYVVDLGGDVRVNPKLSGTKHNVFGIQTGVAISFLVKREKRQGCRIFYTRRPEFETADEKLEFLGSSKIGHLEFEEINPDGKGNWINQAHNDFDSLLPIASKGVKAAKTASQEKAIFKLFSLGVITARDEWVYDEDKQKVQNKVQWLIDAYNADLSKLNAVRDSKKLAEMLDTSIKWTRAVKNDLRNGRRYEFDRENVIQAVYRPFVKSNLYFDKRLNEMQYQLPSMFTGTPNPTIAFLCVFSSNPLAAMGVNQPFDYCLLKMGNGGTQAVSYWVYDDSGNRKENITDWALDQFKKHYQPGRAKPKRPIDKEAIFHYVYGVLHDPVYREKYALNLRREFPRIPFYPDFWQWADWGKELMDLHIGYEGVAPAKLKRTDTPAEKAKRAGLAPKAMLKADKEAGRITLDSETTLGDIPREAWEYKLGNRSALEWILDQYKESKPKDPTIREKFDTYRFADYKDHVIDLLMRVTTVSVRTVAIVKSMNKAAR